MNQEIPPSDSPEPLSGEEAVRPIPEIPDISEDADRVPEAESAASAEAPEPVEGTSAKEFPGADDAPGEPPEPPSVPSETEPSEPSTETPERSESPEAPAVDTVTEADADDGADEDAAPVWVPEPDKLLLSLLFASQDYLDARGLREIMGPEWDTPRLRQLVRGINRELDAAGMPFEVAETEGTFRLRTQPRYFPWTRKLFKEAAPRRLSQAALETLAIVAYKQPVTKAEIEAIRGVNVDGSMKTLLDKRLIDIGRRSDALGQAFTYHTTRDFMRYFGINRVPDDLPRLSEFDGILNAQSLIPQMDEGGDLREVTRSEEDPEQMSLGMGGTGTPSD